MQLPAPQRRSVVLYPIELTSEDRFLKGSVRIPEGAADFSLFFRATAENGLDLGTFEKLEAGATDSPTLVYTSVDEILSDAEFEQSQTGTLDPRATTQPVVFYRDASDPRLLHFATAFDQSGEIEITLAFGPVAQRVTGIALHTLVPQTETAALLGTMDQRIESIHIPELPDFDLDLDGDGVPDGGPADLVTASQPGTMSAPGPFVPEAAEDDPLNLVLLVNSDDDNADGIADSLHSALASTDDDLATIVLRAPADTAAGTLTLTHNGGSALRLRFPDGSVLASGATLDLASPAGALAPLVTGSLTVYAEGLVPAADVAITLAYRPPGEIEPTLSDTVRLTVLDASALAALRQRHRYFPAPGDLGGILSRAYAANGAYRQQRLGLVPIGENLPLQNRGLLAKVLLPITGPLRSQAAYFRGIADGFCLGIKGDGEALGDAFFYVFMEDNRLARAKALAVQFGELAKMYYSTPPSQRPIRAAQLGGTLIRGLYTEAEAELGWDPLLPGIDPQVMSYMVGIGTGFVTEQVAVALIPIGGTAAVLTGKVGLVLRGVIAATATGERYILPAFDATVKASAKVTKALSRIGRSEEEVRNSVQAAQTARRVETAAGKAPLVLDELFKAKPQLGEDILRIWQEALPAAATAGPKRFAYLETDMARFLAYYGDDAATLSDDAVKGFAHLQGRLFKTGEDTASRGADFERFFRDLDTVAKRDALKESLITYKQAAEIDADAPFIIKNITAISPHAYRYSSFVPDGGWASFSGSLPNRPEGWWCSFDFYDNRYIATDRLLLPLETSAPLYRYEFATSEIVDKARLGRGLNDSAQFFEPLTRDVPSNFIGGGTSVIGAGNQFKAEGVSVLRRIVNMNTGQQVWPLL